MANIMASAERVACAAAGLLLTASMTRAADLPVDGYDPLSANYSFILDKDHGSDDYSVFHFAVAEEFGVVSGGFAASDDPRLKPLTRLDSAWNLSAPLISLPMRIGDGVSSADLWSQPARLGGVQIGNYQPATPPVVAPPTMLALPYQQTGPEAPYTTRFMDHLRSVLQWQQAGLTAADQSEFSVESGRLRENFEVRSNDYGPWFTSGTYRYGLNQATTVDAEFAEVAHAQNYLGLGVLEGLGAVGTVSARVASSHDGESYGWLTVLGADYRHDQINLALRSNIQSPAFQDVGDAAVIEPLRQRTLASAGVDLGGLGRISLAGAAQLYTDDSRRDVLALSHAMHFGGGGIISTAAAYSPGPFGNAALLLSFTYPFDAIGRSARTLDRAVASTLDESMVDAFGIPKMPTVGRIALDRPGQPIY
jgi:outer membrane usher protein